MLRFGQNEVAWKDISAINMVAEDSGIEVSITVEETVLVVGTYLAADHATSVKNVIEASRVASAFGGVVITIDIDSL
jgi:hypothetical protein